MYKLNGTIFIMNKGNLELNLSYNTHVIRTHPDFVGKLGKILKLRITNDIKFYMKTDWPTLK